MSDYIVVSIRNINIYYFNNCCEIIVRFFVVIIIQNTTGCTESIILIMIGEVSIIIVFSVLMSKYPRRSENN